ncbi:F0F1 ATP synthase subunit epsilon [Roseicella sp. DB1501]|uniref:F0F1 ATP synthase subunit epsilon n=1 Tax=Roseicella sp. DB1501 TaxID=2730925 RepID=UPI001492C08F|nr:F0F1 ATP synthase subunit epsilon [Roseicella sp. DB1501]
MKLLLTDTLRVIVDHDDIVSLRAEDASGSFGILPGHADLLTVLAVSVLSWRHADGRQRFCAVRGGIMTVRGGREIAIATREGRLGDSAEALERTVLAEFLAAVDAERTQRVAEAQMQLRVVRQVVRILHAGHDSLGLSS